MYKNAEQALLIYIHIFKFDKYQHVPNQFHSWNYDMEVELNASYKSETGDYGNSHMAHNTIDLSLPLQTMEINWQHTNCSSYGKQTKYTWRTLHTDH